MNPPGLELTAWRVAALAVSAFLAGFAKTGVVGAGAIITPLMASAFPAGFSLGFMLPLYLAGDLFVIGVLKRRPLWKTLRKAVFWGLIGVLAGWRAAGIIAGIPGPGSEARLRTAVGIIMALVVGIGTYVSRHPELALEGGGGGERAREAGPDRVRTWYAASLGTFGGLASMLTNSGGPIWGLYYSSLGLEVREVINTSAWCYFLLTLLKIPLSANLGFLDWSLQRLNLFLTPLMILGLLAGGKLSDRIGKKTFGEMVRVLAAGGSIYMILS
ncbi:MAG: sulfite exporter TauE/SafE family protein [Planctomycetota bacterium]|jgi:hypothetical protein|nr:sulfite exporter TauE/SafE family protein [Planctomycetota bacterium]